MSTIVFTESRQIYPQTPTGAVPMTPHGEPFVFQTASFCLHPEKDF